MFARIVDDHTLDIGKSIIANVGAVFLVPGRFVRVTIEEIPTIEAIERAAARARVDPDTLGQLLAEEIHEGGEQHARAIEAGDDE